ncbi:MAG: PepSY domain-containing protein [Christensenellales bacterium]
MKQKLRQAIDSNLSGLVVTQEHRLAIQQAIEGGKPMKRKMSLALAVTLALLLVAAVALAAVILGGKDVVDQFITPLARKNDSQRFTKEEVDEVLAFAREHGIELDEISLRSIQEEGSYFKEELAMLFAKKELGFYPGAWSIADQYWFGEFWNSIDPDIINFNTLPGEGELNQDQIDEIAGQHIREMTGADYDVFNPERYLVSRSFTAVRENPWYILREWQLNFEPRVPDAPFINMALTPQGEVTDYSDNLDYINDPDPQIQADRLLGHYARNRSDIYGSWDAWSQQDWQELRAGLDAIGLTPDQAARDDLKHILSQTYTPPEGAITREQAVDIAAGAVSGRFKADKAELLDTAQGKLPPETQVYAIYLEAGGRQRWKVSFERDYLAEIDALSGQVMVCDVYSPGNDYYRRYILDDLLPEDKRAYATPRPTIDFDYSLMEDDTPLPFTRDNPELAPAWYWERLRGLGYTTKTAAGIMGRLDRDYGPGDRYWPVEYQSMYYMINYKQDTKPGDAFPGIPHESDLQQEEAVALAMDSALAAARAEGREVPEGLRTVTAFTFHLYGRDSRTWQIDLINLGDPPVEIRPDTDFAYVKIDAITGELLDVTFPDTKSREAAPVSCGVDPEGPWSAMGPDMRPLAFAHKAAPKAFWDWMAENFGDRGTVERAVNQWIEEYGEDDSFWPLHAKAVTHLWLYMPEVAQTDLEQGQVTILGLPQPEHLTQEQAEARAWELLREAGKDVYTQEDYDAVRLKTAFFYSAIYPNGCAWQIEFADRRNGFDTSIGDVTLDGLTGEPLTVSAQQGNG